MKLTVWGQKTLGWMVQLFNLKCFQIVSSVTAAELSRSAYTEFVNKELQYINGLSWANNHKVLDYYATMCLSFQKCDNLISHILKMKPEDYCCVLLKLVLCSTTPEIYVDILHTVLCCLSDRTQYNDSHVVVLKMFVFPSRSVSFLCLACHLSWQNCCVNTSRLTYVMQKK